MTFRLLTILTLFLCLVPSAQAIEPETGREGSAFALVGVGRVRQLDTYLSPLEYQGQQVTFLTGRERMTRMADRHVSFQSLLEGAFTHTDNAPMTATYWGGRLAYDAGWHYHWQPITHLRLKAGALVGADVGFLYNTRNGNNPAQGRLSLDVSLSAGASYDFHLRRLPLAVRYQADMPVAGCMFSPQYGQSYYELSLGSRDHNAVFAHPGNALSFRHLLTLDLVFPRTTLRMGYMGDIRQSHVNNLKVHDIAHSFMLGYVRYFSLLHRGQRKEVDTL